PSTQYPWSWSVVPWVAGRSAGTLAPGARARLAAPLAAIVDALHAPAPPEAPDNPVRCRPVRTRGPVVRRRLASGDVPRAAELAALWADLVATPPWAGPAVWLHGDLHPHNLVVDDDGALAAVVDFGDL